MIVVGAGLAGLTAAYELAEAGFAVTVLEARARVGGRVHTWRFPDGQHAEAGGEHIGTAHVAVRTYAGKFGLALDDLRNPSPPRPHAVHRHGVRRRSQALFTSALLREIDRYQAILDMIADQLDVSDPRSRMLDGRSVADLLDALKLSPAAREVIEHRFIRDEYGVEARELSLLLLAGQNDVDPDHPELDEAAFRIEGGNERLPLALAEALGADMHLEAPVERIAYSARGVKVSARGRTFAGELCVIAAPLPALRRVDFAPALAAPLVRAIAELQYGIGTKTALQYRRRFWYDAGLGGGTLTDLPISTTWEATNAQPGAAGILIAYTMGDHGRRLTTLSDDARIAQTRQELARIYPESRALLGPARTVAWAQEPYSGGTYTAYAPRQVMRYWRALRRPRWPLILAGEHTDSHTGDMEGAVRSGHRAATLIARR